MRHARARAVGEYEASASVRRRHGEARDAVLAAYCNLDVEHCGQLMECGGVDSCVSRLNVSDQYTKGVFPEMLSSSSPLSMMGDSERARAHLAAIVDSSEDGIVSKTLEGIVTSWNKAAERLFGYSSQEMVGKPIAL